MKEDQLNKENNGINEDLSNWKKELQKKLLKNSSKNESELIYLVSSYWLDNYEKLLLNKNNNKEENSSKFEDIKEMNNFLFSSFCDETQTIKDFPKIFALNKNFGDIIKNQNYELNLIIHMGFFGKKGLIINILPSIYCFFVMDSKNQIRQGYLKVIRTDIENDIKKTFLKEGLLELFKTNKERPALTDDKLEFGNNYLQIFIFELFDKKEENKDYQKDLKESFIKRNKAINLKKSQVFYNPDKFNYIFGNEVINLSKNVNINFTQAMGNIVKKSIMDFSNDLKKDEDKNQNKEKVDIKEKRLEMFEINDNSEEIKRNTVILRGRRNQQNFQGNQQIFQGNQQNFQGNQQNFQGNQQNFQGNYNFNFYPQYFQPQPMQKQSIPGIIGLQNIGATCYMNATLQCLSHITGLRDYLLREDKYQSLKFNKDKCKLSFALAEVLYNLWKVLNHDYYEPEYFKKMIGEMNPIFKGVAANDPKDLIFFLLETMHGELNKPPNKEMNHNYFVNNQNFNAVFQDFLIHFTNENRSIICDLFYGLTNSMTICGGCRTMIHNVQAINIFFFPLEEVRKFMNYPNPFVYIEDCFRYYEKQDFYPSFYCNNCRRLYPGYNQTKIIYAPPTLIINLNRGRGLQFNIGIGFSEYLNIRNYVFANDSPCYYELIGVISHLGSNDMGGHFIAFCKNRIYNGCQWYKYNDGMVTLSSFQEASTFGIPYVLFYSNMK